VRRCVTSEWVRKPREYGLLGGAIYWNPPLGRGALGERGLRRSLRAAAGPLLCEQSLSIDMEERGNRQSVRSVGWRYHTARQLHGAGECRTLLDLADHSIVYRHYAGDLFL
jgi:hypothetical protein